MSFARSVLVALAVTLALTTLVGCLGSDQAVTATRDHPLFTIGVLCAILAIVAFAFWKGIGTEPKGDGRGRPTREQSPYDRNGP